jgi:hypothetical protein
MMKRTLVVLGTIAGVTALGAAPTMAKSVDVAGTAACSAGIKAKLKAGPRDPGQIKTNVQIDDAGNVRRAWTITVTDGAETRTAVATTAGASNSIDMDFFTSNNAGADSVSFTATRAGGSCSGQVVVP